MCTHACLQAACITPRPHDNPNPILVSSRHNRRPDSSGSSESKLQQEVSASCRKRNRPPIDAWHNSLVPCTILDHSYLLHNLALHTCFVSLVRSFSRRSVVSCSSLHRSSTSRFSASAAWRSDSIRFTYSSQIGLIVEQRDGIAAACK